MDYFNCFNRKRIFLNLAEQGEILLMNFACNYFKFSEICYDKIIENIQSGKMANSLPMYTRPQKLGVLAIEMLASEKRKLLIGKVQVFRLILSISASAKKLFIVKMMKF